MRSGGVALQTLAIFSMTTDSPVELAARQLECFEELLSTCEGWVERVEGADGFDARPGRPVRLVAAIENASGVCAEDEALEVGLERLESMISRVGPLLYVSLTWNHENRFGGGKHLDRGPQARRAHAARIPVGAVGSRST